MKPLPSKNCPGFCLITYLPLLPIQVAYSLTPFNREREIGGLKYFRKQADVKRSILVTFDQTEKLEDGMEVVPFYQLRSVLESDD